MNPIKSNAKRRQKNTRRLSKETVIGNSWPPLFFRLPFLPLLQPESKQEKEVDEKKEQEWEIREAESERERGMSHKRLVYVTCRSFSTFPGELFPSTAAAALSSASSALAAILDWGLGSPGEESIDSTVDVVYIYSIFTCIHLYLFIYFLNMVAWRRGCVNRRISTWKWVGNEERRRGQWASWRRSRGNHLGCSLATDIYHHGACPLEMNDFVILMHLNDVIKDCTDSILCLIWFSVLNMIVLSNSVILIHWIN